jgi:hypothetical protein
MRVRPPRGRFCSAECPPEKRLSGICPATSRCLKFLRAEEGWWEFPATPGRHLSRKTGCRAVRFLPEHGAAYAEAADRDLATARSACLVPPADSPTGCGAAEAILFVPVFQGLSQ